MQHYTIVLMNGREYEITESERDAVLGKNGFIFLPRLGLSLNTASVSVMEPSGLGKKIDRTKQFEGMLSDGTRVLKQFGRWFCIDGEKDENGNLLTEPDPNFYVEVAWNTLPTPEEYERDFKHLPVSEWKAKLIGLSSEVDDRLLIDRDNRSTGGGFQKIGPSDAPRLKRDDDDESGVPVPA